MDGFESNPLGSIKKKHKLVGIYMAIGNIPSWQRSQVDNIHLIALVYERDTRYCVNELLELI